MYCVKKMTEDLYWVGGNDRRLALFENVYPIPRGVSYNAYVVLDEKTVLLDTVDHSVSPIFFENLAQAGLSDRQPHGAGPRRHDRGRRAPLSRGHARLQ